MTLREQLKEQLEADYLKAPKKYWNLNETELFWNEDEKIYIGLDTSKQEWIASLQHTRVPIFSVLCPNQVRKGNVEVECKSVNFVPICNGGNIKCRKCKETFIPQLNIPKSSAAFKIFENLDR